MGWSIERFTDRNAIIDELICSICKEVLENPMQMQCQHLFCNDCIYKWFKDGTLTCPVDRQGVEDLNMIKPARLAQQLLSNLTVRCKYFDMGCGLMAQFKHMDQVIDHEKNHCHCHPAQKNNSLRNEYEKLVVNAAGQKKTIENQEQSIYSLREQVEEQREQLNIDSDIIDDQKKTIVDKTKIIQNLMILNTEKGQTISELPPNSPKSKKHPWQY